MSGHEQVAALLDGRLDVAVCLTPAGPENGLAFRVVRLDPLLVALLGRQAISNRPDNPSARTVATAEGGNEDRDLAGFLSDFERAAGCSLERVAVTAGSGTEAYEIRRSGARAFVTLASPGVRLDVGAAIQAAPQPLSDSCQRTRRRKPQGRGRAWFRIATPRPRLLTRSARHGSDERGSEVRCPNARNRRSALITSAVCCARPS
jgi:hypothetical protein